MDDEDEYEIQRQKQIKENRMLLESLGLNSETVRIRSPSPPRPPPKPQPKKREPRTSSNSPALEAQPRQRSARLAASRPTRAYNEKELARLGYEHGDSKKAGSSKRARQAVAGTRKSRRLSAQTSGGRGKYAESDTSSGEESDDRKPVQLKRLKNPLPPPPFPLRGDTSAVPVDGDSEEDWDKEDAEAGGGGGRDERGEYDAEGVYKHRMPLPTRETLPEGMQGRGVLLFEHEWSHFRPNLTPEEVLRGGAFGGTFFRPHYSTVLKRDLSPSDDIAEMPDEWLHDLDVESLLTAEDYNPEVNRYGRKAGQSLSEWEKAGWIVRADPRGWFQWYLRFYLGRRSLDDARQVSRWQRACGPAGRFKRSVATQVAKNSGRWDDEEVSPVIRQVCWQWAYELSERDYKEYLPDGG